MRQASSPAAAGWQSPFKKLAESSPPLARVVYRSRAVKPMQAPDLLELTTAAQRRNGREGITGLMLYDNDRFFQWLEGPEDSVERVMGDIYVDRRHTEVEVLNKQPAEMRAFAAWSMKLAAPGQASTAWNWDVIEPPREIVEDLRKTPEAAPALLIKLVSATARGAETAALDAVAANPLNRKAADILKNLFLAAVIPQLARKNAGFTARQTPPASRRAGELAELLVASDSASALELIEELQADGAAIGLLAATLFEPAARRLGDLWGEDFCSEFDVTVGLCRLQTAVRTLTAGAAPRRPSRLHQPVVLIAPEPGELHRLGAALDRTVLESAGWSPHCEYPTDDNALDDVLSAQWFDVLDLSLSPAFRRDDTLPKLAETIAQARRASRNPGLVVVVGGRVFNEERAAGHAVGADGSNASSLNVNRSILRTLNVARTVTPEVTPA
jgi:methanogenic corrinoid protein MtbC1